MSPPPSAPTPPTNHGHFSPSEVKQGPADEATTANEWCVCVSIVNFQGTGRHGHRQGSSVSFFWDALVVLGTFCT